MRRLGIWSRLGIVISVLWAVGAGVYSFDRDSKAAESLALIGVNLCKEAADAHSQLDHSIPNYEPCWNHYPKAYWIWMGDWKDKAVSLALLPVILGWLLAFAAVRTARWVLAGRQA